MKLIKWGPAVETRPFFSNFLDGFFDNDLSTFIGRDAIDTIPAVNVIDEKDVFKVEVAAPGMKKEDFNVNVENDRLTLSVEKKESNGVEGKITRREYRYGSFTRSFMLPETVKQDKINATYNDGILKVTIPKKEEAKQKLARKIKIA